MVLNASALTRICFIALHLLVSCILIISIGLQPFFVDSAPAPAPSPELTKLIHNICKNTTDYHFCEKSFLSDPRTNPLPADPLAQQKAAAEVAFGLASGYASYVSYYIDRLLKNATNLEQQLQECATYYGLAIEELTESLVDINDDNMTALGGPAETASLAASGCDSAFKGSHNSPLTAMNRRMRLLSEICLVLSKLFAKQFASTISCHHAKN